MTTTPPTPESVLAEALRSFDCNLSRLEATGDRVQLVMVEPALLLAASPTLASAIALGLALSRAFAAADDNTRFIFQRGTDNGEMPESWFVVAEPISPPDEGMFRIARDVTIALIALAEALEARRGE